MAEPRSLSTISEAEYETIEAAVLETARGRWFLAEYARRNRTADTNVLLEAIGRLESAVLGEPTAHGLDRLRFDLMEMAKAISRTKTEIAAIHPADREQSRLEAASEALDGIVRTTETATSDILEAAEHVQEAAWTLREDGVDERLCDELDRRATEIYTACSFQDLTAQRTGRIVQTLRYLEGRINAMIDIWGGEREHDEAESATIHPFVRPVDDEPQAPDLSQSDVDIVIVDEDDLFGGAVPQPVRPAVAVAPSPVVTVAPEETAAVEPASPAPGEPLVLADLAPADEALDDVEPALARAESHAASLRLEAFAEIDGLATREKLRRFT